MTASGDPSRRAAEHILINAEDRLRSTHLERIRTVRYLDRVFPMRLTSGASEQTLAQTRPLTPAPTNKTLTVFRLLMTVLLLEPGSLETLDEPFHTGKRFFDLVLWR